MVTLSVFFSNCKIGVVRCRGLGKCHIQLAMGEKTSNGVCVCVCVCIYRVFHDFRA